ncbi:MAG: 5-(carboxyamino)imidazole ribonucleotide synthase [Gammaproteobacteria bacterium RIFCSPLOWO2_02_FULL_61_13]|nr:MAG: 5-(carboxyamino)imidazole ribonucleotide synthase [Gammaproteobacteria bacterium RIFCSPLOWO2_02_FULL_61_13]
MEPVRNKDHPRIGIIGGGQLAKMTALAGLQLGCDVIVLERSSASPAATLALHSIVGDWNDPEVLLQLAAQSDVITLENEFVDAGALRVLEASGARLLPTAHSIALTQDKFVQKSTLAEAGLPVSAFRMVASTQDIHDAGREYGWPVVLKTRRNGYDGKGNFTVRSAADAATGWENLGAGKAELFVEAFCSFDRELAAIITRARDGSSAAYPVVESVQRDHICHVIKAPASLPADVGARAAELARRAVAAVGGLGSFGVEMFLMVDGSVLINELAPRVHNSGHYTIEACECSQFENHVRAVLGWPLGSTRMIVPAAVMVNLLGVDKGSGWPAGLNGALEMPGVHVHIYGKAHAGRGRKMGHVCALGTDPTQVLSRANSAAEMISFGGQP